MGVYNIEIYSINVYFTYLDRTIVSILLYVNDLETAERRERNHIGEVDEQQ